MAKKAGNRVLVDTNILIYADVPESPLHSVSQAAISNLFREGKELWISRQIIREYLSYMTRPGVIQPPPSKTTILNAASNLLTSYKVAEDNDLVTIQLFELVRTIPGGGKQIHDANIVATMLVYEIPVILTHNVSDFRRFSPLVEVMPLEAGGEKVG